MTSLLLSHVNLLTREENSNIASKINGKSKTVSIFLELLIRSIINAT